MHGGQQRWQQSWRILHLHAKLCGGDIVARREINDFAATLLRTVIFATDYAKSFLRFSYFS